MVSSLSPHSLSLSFSLSFSPSPRGGGSKDSIGDRDAGGTQRSFPIPLGPAREATPLIYRGVVGKAAPLALPRSREDGSRSQRSRHSAENRRKSRGDPIELRVESALAIHGGRFGKRGQYQLPIVEPTCAAFGTTKKQPRASNGGKAKERPSCPCSIPLRICLRSLFTCAQWGVGVRSKLSYFGEKVGISFH